MWIYTSKRGVKEGEMVHCATKGKDEDRGPSRRDKDGARSVDAHCTTMFCNIERPVMRVVSIYKGL